MRILTWCAIVGVLAAFVSYGFGYYAGRHSRDEELRQADFTGNYWLSRFLKLRREWDGWITQQGLTLPARRSAEAIFAKCLEEDAERARRARLAEGPTFRATIAQLIRGGRS